VHPESDNYYFSELTDYDNAVWDLKTYGKCLEDWDTMNDCLELASKDFAQDYSSEKLRLRLGGLQLLREVDNCG
jgi:hypothetical protein